MTTNFTEINFSPFASNVLDYVNAEGLQTIRGEKVTISRDRLEFVITVDGKEAGRTDDNLSASYILNSMEVGLVT